MDYIKLMRPKHYIKNLLIFLPLVFSGNFLNLTMLSHVILAFFAFNFSASSVYIINDIKDKEKDKLHKKKKDRPIASGRVKVSNAIIMAIILFAISLCFQYFASRETTIMSFLYILVYILINLLYSFGLKNLPLVDIVILVSGFLIRVLYGASIIGVPISCWLYLTIISGAFYLGLGKRRNEIKKGTDTRNVLKYYNQEFLDKNMYVHLAVSIVFYALWTVAPETTNKSNNLLIWTVPVIIIILMKYSLDIENDSFADPTDVVFSDKILMFFITAYIVFVMSIIYLF